jgi:hypothetical protein
LEWGDSQLRTDNHTWEAKEVNSSTGSTILFSDSTKIAVPDNWGYYFDNLLSILDTAGEWYYDPINQKLFFQGPSNEDPDLLVVEVSVFDYGIITQSSNYINIENLSFQAQKLTGIAIKEASKKINIFNCAFRLQGESGIAGASAVTIVS